ncbi:MAG: zinc ribbon domain-containing protein [Desulfobacterales bacterium]
MPIYEYECTKCGQIEEALQKFSDKPLKKCTHCGAKLQKLMSQSTFHLKGTGWYVTDYANKSKSDPTAVKKGSTSTANKTGNSSSTDTKKAKPAKDSST